MTTVRAVAATAGMVAVLALGGPAAALVQPGNEPSPGGARIAIIGGHAPSRPYPGMASLQVQRPGESDHHTCGAILAPSRRAVVVNAHCVAEFDEPTPLPAELFHVRIGSPDRTSGGILASVTKVLPHAEWDWAHGDDRVADVALLQLDTYVQAQPFEIAPRLAGAGASTRLLGWGVTDPAGQGPLPIDLQELDSRILPDRRCAAAGITAGEICVANPNGTDGACFGDSGGPALQQVGSRRWSAVGGASRNTIADCGLGPTVYTNLAYYRTWIYQVMRTGIVPPRDTPERPAPATRGSQPLRWLGGR